MYEGIDEDLARNFDGKKLASKERTPDFPHVDNGNFECLLKQVRKEKTSRGKKLYKLYLSVTKSNNELVLEGKTYGVAFFPGADDVDAEMFWRFISYPIMAVFGATDIGDFNTPEKLGELLAICKDESIELDLPFRLQTKLEAARPDKDTGKYKPKQLDDNGKPKVYRRDTFSPLTTATV